MVIIGIDPHSTTHVAAAVDEHGQLLASIQVGASLQQLQHLLGWVGGFQGPRLVAVEGARGYGLASPECCWRPGSGSWMSPRP
jgi:hypothetical protein